MRIFNSINGRVQKFQPLQAGEVGIYVCGITVYDFCHLGHARSFVAFDGIVRYLKYRGYRVNYVRNITDVDDKIIAAAARNKEDVSELTRRMIAAMHTDFDRLGMLSPDREPRATEHIAEMLEMIEQLIEQGHAYASGGDVYFDVRSWPKYGALSNRSLVDIPEDEQQQDGSGDGTLKKFPLDFALWKRAQEHELGWDSSWGRGRPGWHLECSAMSKRHLGECFDIHGGGIDLKFPHHENEIAQSQCATQGEFARYWMHTGSLTLGKGEKMSKSLGNALALNEVLQQWEPEVVYFFLIGVHYRSPMEYSPKLLQQAERGLRRLYTALRGIEHSNGVVLDEYVQRFCAAMDEDFNTPQALAVLFDLARDINRCATDEVDKKANLAVTLRHLGQVFNILGKAPEDYLRGAQGDIDEELVNKLVAERTLARDAGDFARADAIRIQLADMGVGVLDGSGATRWEKI